MDPKSQPFWDSIGQKVDSGQKKWVDHFTWPQKVNLFGAQQGKRLTRVRKIRLVSLHGPKKSTFLGLKRAKGWLASEKSSWSVYMAPKSQPFWGSTGLKVDFWILHGPKKSTFLGLRGPKGWQSTFLSLKVPKGWQSTTQRQKVAKSWLFPPGRPAFVLALLKIYGSINTLTTRPAPDYV